MASRNLAYNKKFVGVHLYVVYAICYTIAASILPPPLTKNGVKSQLPPFLPPPQRNEKKIPPFSPFPHLDFEINSPPGASRIISTLKMSQMVEILILDLVLIVN